MPGQILFERKGAKTTSFKALVWLGMVLHVFAAWD
jgi:hypothetical protein